MFFVYREDSQQQRLLNFISTFIKICDKIPSTEGRSQALIACSSQELCSKFR